MWVWYILPACTVYASDPRVAFLTRMSRRGNTKGECYHVGGIFYRRASDAPITVSLSTRRKKIKTHVRATTINSIVKSKNIHRLSVGEEEWDKQGQARCMLWPSGMLSLMCIRKRVPCEESRTSVLQMCVGCLPPSHLLSRLSE